MSYDIYGERLQRGHCEVHPWVAVEWPCPICMQESSAQKAERRAYDEDCRKLQQEQYEEMVADTIVTLFTTA